MSADHVRWDWPELPFRFDALQQSLVEASGAIRGGFQFTCWGLSRQPQVSPQMPSPWWTKWDLPPNNPKIGCMFCYCVKSCNYCVSQSLCLVKKTSMWPFNQNVFIAACCWLLTGFRGGRDLMNSRIISCALFFNLGGMFPFTLKKNGLWRSWFLFNVCIYIPVTKMLLKPVARNYHFHLRTLRNVTIIITNRTKHEYYKTMIWKMPWCFVAIVG